MLITEYYIAICEKMGIDVSTLPDRLGTTYLIAICENLGIDADSLPDRLISTYLDAICENLGITVDDRLYGTYLEAILNYLGADTCDDRLRGSQLSAIAANVKDKYSWEAVAESIEAGTYATDYAIGDLIPLDLGTEGQINMQIAAFDADNLADGTGKAHISFVAKELLTTSHRMNPALESTTDDEGNTVYTEGTGAAGGWEKCELRTYLGETIYPLIPEDVRGMIQTVMKYSTSYDTSNAQVADVATEDGVWIPSHREVMGRTTVETTGPTYTQLFTGANARIKKSTTGLYRWWFRSGYSAGLFYRTTASGSTGNDTGSVTNGVALGFCV